MNRATRSRHVALGLLLLAAAVFVPGAARAQEGEDGPLREAAQLDREGATTRARAIVQAVIDSATSPADRAEAYRAMAMSYAFDGDCANVLEYEQMVIDYWTTREEAEPQEAFLDSDPAMAEQQERFFPYLVGYVALYTNDLTAAEAALTEAVATRGNEDDPFMNVLLAMTFDRMGREEEAKALYRKAYDLAQSHNPPAAFVRRFVPEKLGAELTSTSDQRR